MKNMKILIFNTYNRSFLSDFFVELSNSLLKNENSVKIYSFKKDKGYKRLESGLEIKILKKGNKIFNYYTLFHVLKEEQPDVVVSNFSYVNPVVLASKVLGIRNNIIWYHTLREQMQFSKSSIFIKSHFMNLASAIITNSKELKEEIAKDYNQKPDKVYNLPFTTSVTTTKVDNIDLIHKQGSIYIGCPGRLNKDKNQKILLDSLPFINNKNIILVFAGEDEENVLKSHPNYKKYISQIIYLGVLSREKMIGFYNKMDIIVLPSLNEAFGLVYIEALALGKKTLVSNKFGALDYIKEDTGDISFDPKNIEELVDKIQNLLTSNINSNYFKDLYDSNFSMDQIVSSFNKIINR